MNALWFFLRLFKTHQQWLTGGFLLSLLTAFAGLALLMLSGWFITTSAVTGMRVVDVAAISFNFMLPAAQIRALAILRTVGRYGERLITHEATFRALASIRSWFFQQMIPLAPGRLATLRSGELLSHMTTDIDSLDALYVRLLLPISVAILGVFGITIFLAQYSVLISLSTASLLLIASMGVPWLFNNLWRPGAEQNLILAANFRLRQLDLLQGMADLISHQAMPRFNALLQQCSDRMLDTQQHNNQLTAIATALTLLLAQLALLLALGLAILLLQENRLSGPELALIVFGVIAAFELVMPLSPALQMLGKVEKAASRILQVARLSPTVMPPVVATDLPDRYDLRLDNVSFRYTDDQTWILKDLSLAIPQGSKIAIVGASGSGKSTLLQLLMRYYDPTSGQVSLAGTTLKQFKDDALASCFGLLSQRTQLFAASIKENLLLANPHATTQELADAINAAGLQDFVRSLPKGLQTWVGESGINVSGGEARRLALARLYLKNAPVLILDEPTEGLDSATEQAIFKRLMAFAKHKTLIMVTHRNVGLSLVDKVYHLQQGVLMES